MATYISIHDAKTIRAHTVQDYADCSPHITLEFETPGQGDARTVVTVYLPDAEFNQRLIDLINGASYSADAGERQLAEIKESIERTRAALEEEDGKRFPF